MKGSLTTKKAKTRFLVVDDSPHMRQSLKNLLNVAGFEYIHLAKNGEEAIKWLKSHFVECIVSDWNMPEATGYDLLKFVRADERLKNISFMLVSAEVQRQNINMAIHAGVTDFLIKPFTAAMLEEKIHWMLDNPLQSRLDRKPAATKKQKPSLPEQKSISERPTVIVVDDVPDNIDIISGFLKDTYHIKAALNGEKALKIIQKSAHIDLVLLDIMMPEMDGLEVCRRLKKDPQTKDIPVIFLTAKSENSDITKGFELGAVDYIIKPIAPGVLKARVNTHIMLKRTRDSLYEQIDTLVENARLHEDVERITRHDIKNPLSAIISESELLMKDESLGERQKSQIETLCQSSYDILNMINRSLDLYKMEAGTYNYTPQTIDIAAITAKVIRNFRGEANKKRVKIILNAPNNCLVRGEELLSFSMLGNLLRNAIEASPPGSEVKISISEKQKNKIQIHNKGVIPAEIRNNFFDKYATSGKEGGTGIGTYSAYLMAKSQAGDITFETSEAKGTTLTVSLPAL